MLILPVLFLFFNILLIEEYIKINLLIQVRGFVDDIYLLAYSESIKKNYKNLGRAYNIYLK